MWHRKNSSFQLSDQYEIELQLLAQNVWSVNDGYPCAMTMGEGNSPGVFFAASSNGNGYRLSARGVQTLQTFLREHGADCMRQFMQVRFLYCKSVCQILILLGFWRDNVL